LSLQSIQHRFASKNIDELIDVVIRVFAESNRETLNKVFLSIMQCMLETIKIDGENSYKLVHMKKSTLDRAGNLPLTIPVDDQTLETARNFIQFSTLD
jgi:hypothetical protein